MTRGIPISKEGERRTRFASSVTTTARSCHCKLTARCQETKATGKPRVSRTRVSDIKPLRGLGGSAGTSARIHRLEGGRPMRLDDAPSVFEWIELVLPSHGN